MTKTLQIIDPLADNRRHVLGRSIAAGFAGLIPIPIVEEWLVATVKQNTVTMIATNNQIDIDKDAASHIANGPQAEPNWSKMAGSLFAVRLATRLWRRLIFAYLASRRVQAIGHNFVVGTLFDYYCQRFHTGMGIDLDKAQWLRKAIDEAIRATPGQLSHRVLQNGLRAAVKTSTRAPLSLADVATGGAVSQWLERRGAIATGEEVDTAIEAQLNTKDSFLARAVASLELQLSRHNNAYLDNVLTQFEDSLIARGTASADTASVDTPPHDEAD